MHPPKSLYYLVQQSGIPVYSPQNTLLGLSTGCLTRPNGTPESIGSIEIDVNGEKWWMTGYGVYVVGMGIKMTKFVND